VTDWKDNDAPKFQGVKIGLDNYERARALAVRPDGSGFALGTVWYVRAFDAAGEPLWKQPSPSEARGVDFIADGQILVVTYSDGATRWLRGADGVELLALFVDVPTRRWVALDADRLLHGFAWRRGSDRLAYQSRLDSRGRFLLRLALLGALQPTRHSATRAEDA
jgi:hypothetical protein